MAVIGIDATAFSNRACGGIGTAQYHTLRALAELDHPHQIILYAARPPLIPFSDRPLDLPWPVRLGSGMLARSNIMWMQTGVNRLLARDGVEVFWGPRHLLPFRAHDLATVATVHDFWHRHYPEQQPWGRRTADRVLIGQVVAQADVVVTPSSATAQDVAAFYGARRIGVQIIPWGVDSGLFRPMSEAETALTLERLGVRKPYVLSLDVFNPRKNFTSVLEAVATLDSERDTSTNVGRSMTDPALGSRGELKIVAIGSPRKTASTPDVHGRIRRLGMAGRVWFPGEVGQYDMAALYAGAVALVYPSLYEGFGMPVLEAMACGCPVITSDRSSLAEVAGDCAVLVHPRSVRQLAEAIAHVGSDAAERARLVMAGKARAQQFTWQRTALGMLDAFGRALTVHRRRAARASYARGIT